MARTSLVAAGSSKPMPYKEPPPSIHLSYGKGQNAPEGFEDADVGDRVTLVVRGKVTSKTKDQEGGSIRVEYKDLSIRPGKTHNMSLTEAMDRIEAGRKG